MQQEKSAANVISVQVALDHASEEHPFSIREIRSGLGQRCNAGGRPAWTAGISGSGVSKAGTSSKSCWRNPNAVRYHSAPEYSFVASHRGRSVGAHPKGKAGKQDQPAGVSPSLNCNLRSSNSRFLLRTSSAMSAAVSSLFASCSNVSPPSSTAVINKSANLAAMSGFSAVAAPDWSGAACWSGVSLSLGGDIPEGYR